jgi:two-component system NtrC family sensor kinase
VIETSLRLASFDKSFQRLHLKKEYAENLPMVFADHDQLQQVFLNLFLNARDAMPVSGELFVKTSQSDKQIQALIADSGNGIEEKNLKQIFDPFFTTKPTGKGTGLGLAVCYGIVTAHGGKIEVVANDDGGTKFVINLPINEKSDET